MLRKNRQLRDGSMKHLVIKSLVKRMEWWRMTMTTTMTTPTVTKGYGLLDFGSYWLDYRLFNLPQQSTLVKSFEERYCIERVLIMDGEEQSILWLLLILCTGLSSSSASAATDIP
mmetsp:Transcript_37356/g.55668  ORF Transcript_37356/g.55668 Transcript_37356/m.55668 type:complete len:115 (-) Transcript_37356:856-1200(-)